MKPLLQTERIFASLVKEINNLINEDVIITNENGVIVASTKQSRINNFHEGAYLSIKNKEKMLLTQELSEKLRGVKKGIVLPIIIENDPIGVLGITGDPKKIEPFAKLAQKMSELFIHSIIDQITREKIARNLELFMFDWINDDVPAESLIERGKLYNIDVRKYNLVISIHIPLPTSNLSYKEISLLRTHWDQKGDAIFVRLGQGKLLIIDNNNDRNNLKDKIEVFLNNVNDRIGNDIYVGVGKTVTYEELPISFKQAERACQIAKLENRIIFEEELRFEIIQYELNKKSKRIFIDRTIAPLLDDKVMLHTLNSWLENNMSIQKTAEALHVHKNTLYYRLEKIKALTNLDVNKINDLILLYIGNKFRKENRWKNK